MLQKTFASGRAWVWSTGGGWAWDREIEQWAWCQEGGIVEVSGRQLWHLLAMQGAWVWHDERWAAITPEAVERAGAVTFLSEQLQLVRAQVDPASEASMLAVERDGSLHGLSEEQVRKERVWERRLPRWLVRWLGPTALDAADQKILDHLLAQPWPLKSAAAMAMSGCGTDRFYRIWGQYPEERKLKRGAPRGPRDETRPNLGNITLRKFFRG